MLAALLLALSAHAQTTGGLPHHPDVGDGVVVFTAGGDLWRVPLEGGVAARLTTHPGTERFARLSPDGERIAFTADYEGGADVWVMPALGGPPERLTWHATGFFDDVVWDWTPDGERVLFASRFQAIDGRHFELFTVGLDGGLPEALPTSDAGPAALGADGRLVFNRKFRNFRTWKRYAGGMQQDLWRFDPATGTSERLTDFPGTDTQPMVHADGSVLFVSDRAAADATGADAVGRRNLFRRAEDGAVTQLTFHADWDVGWPALHDDTVVYELGGDLRRLDLVSGEDVAIPIAIPDPALEARPTRLPVAGDSWTSSPGPQARRVAVIAHGDLFTVPVEEGSWRLVDGGSEGRVTEAAWSPEGDAIAFISDRSGELQVWLADQDGASPPRQLTTDNTTWIEGLRWSPDGARLAFTDLRQRLWDIDVATGELTEVATGPVGPIVSARYSHDGSWLAWVTAEEGWMGAVWLRDLRTGANHRVTTGFDDDLELAWDPEGRWLYLVSRRNFDLVGGVFEHRYVHRLTDRVYALRLRADGPDPVPTRSDEEVEPDGTPAFEPEPEEERRKERRRRRRERDEVVPEAPRTRIDLDGLAARLHRLPIEPGSYGGLAATADALFFLSSPGHDDDGAPELLRYDLEEQEVGQVLWNAQGFELAAGGEKLVVVDDQGRLWRTDARADAGWGQHVAMDALATWVDPRVEWRRTLDEVRRYLREHFYDPGMHGRDWDGLHARYAALLERATAPADVHWLIGELIAELNVGHAYVWPAGPAVARVETGRLGADLDVGPSGHARIARILVGEPGDPERTSPLRRPGVDAREGDLILAIDGRALAPGENPYRWLVGAVGRPVRLKLGARADGVGAREVLVEPIASEAELRYWDWVEDRRRRVREATGGRVGYVHVPNTSERGYTEFVRGLYAQHHLDGLVIDVRFNGGGFIPEMFVEPLLRPHYNTWVPRDGADWRTPSIAVHGPKVMITNGYAGSGGDAFPYYFRQFGLGPLVGETTWGGLVGISGSLDLLIGGGVTAPSFAFVNRDGAWDVERIGVVPDLPVVDPPEALRRGEDPQLDAAIAEVVRALETWVDPVPPRPSRYPERP